ncbi:alpha/beta hydrolase family protein [Labrys okinawensis]|uniref:alpha/beta hydrolase family protein n=1 Tax=Labrys okinawensis TaxID=346911 RepID=UPI0039BC24A1
MRRWALSAAGLGKRLRSWQTLSSGLRLVVSVLVTAFGVAGPAAADTPSVAVMTLPLTELCPEAPVSQGLKDVAQRLVVKAWYPNKVQEPPAGSSYPVVLFNAAWGGSSDSHFGQIRELVAHGFVVISIDHRLDLNEYGQFLDFSSQEAFDRTKALADGKARRFASDNIVVLGALTAAAACAASDEKITLIRSLDFNRTGILGYSFGGAVAAQTAWQDPRFKAALNLDGWLFADASTLGVVQPFMEISDDTPIPTPADLDAPDMHKRLVARLNDADYKQLRANMISHGGYYLVISGSNHESFVDVSKRSVAQQLAALLPGSGSIPEIVNAYILSFFERYVAGRPTSLIDQMPSPYKEVSLEFAQAPASSR